MKKHTQIALQKTEKWIVGVTEFRENHSKFVFTFGGVGANGNIIGITSHNPPRKELIKIYSLSDVKQWAENEEIRKEREKQFHKNKLINKIKNC